MADRYRVVGMIDYLSPPNEKGLCELIYLEIDETISATAAKAAAALVLLAIERQAYDMPDWSESPTVTLSGDQTLQLALPLEMA